MKKTTKAERKRNLRIAAIYAAICAARDTDANADTLRDCIAFIRDALLELDDLHEGKARVLTIYTIGQSAETGLKIARDYLNEEAER